MSYVDKRHVAHHHALSNVIILSLRYIHTHTHTHTLTHITDHTADGF